MNKFNCNLKLKPIFISTLGLALFAFSFSQSQAQSDLHLHYNSQIISNSQLDLLPKNVKELLVYEQQYMSQSVDRQKIVEIKNSQDKNYSPSLGRVFQLNSYWIPKSQVDVFKESQSYSELGFEFERRNSQGVEEILLLVHPESESFYEAITNTAQLGPKFFATSTASSRTLVAWPEGNPSQLFFAKLSLNKEISGVVRTIPREEVSRSVGTSLILKESQHQLPKGFLFLPEFFGVVPKGMARGGMLLRAIPKNYIQSLNKKWLPLFSLYSTINGARLSIISQMLQNFYGNSNLNSTESMEAFVKDYIIKPFVKIWVSLVFEQGIAIEAHAQNFLIEVNSSTLQPSGQFIFRDFGGFNVDLEYRKNLLKPRPEILPVLTSEAVDYHQQFHKKAIRQSLETYFEGGFLYGLGETLVQEGYLDLGYQKLTSILHKELQSEITSRGYKWQRDVINFGFYSDLLQTLNGSRSNTNKHLQCHLLFAN